MAILPHSAARRSGSAERTLRTADMVPSVSVASQPASSSSSKRPAAGTDRVHQDVERSPPVRHFLEAGGDGARVRHVHADTDGVRTPGGPERRNGVVERFPPSGHHRHPRSVRGEDVGHRPAHPLASTRHHRRGVSQPEIHFRPPPSPLRSGDHAHGIVGVPIGSEPLANLVGLQPEVRQVIGVLTVRAGRMRCRPAGHRVAGVRVADAIPICSKAVASAPTGSTCRSAKERSAKRSSPTRERKSMARDTASHQRSSCSGPSSSASSRSLLQLRQ